MEASMEVFTAFTETSAASVLEVAGASVEVVEASVEAVVASMEAFTSCQQRRRPPAAHCIRLSRYNRQLVCAIMFHTRLRSREWKYHHVTSPCLELARQYK